MIDCSNAQERLPLLRYGNELSADERLEVLAHLEECSECRGIRDQIEATAASLDAVPLERPETRRLLGLKRRVLEQVGAGCAEEEAVWVRAELDPDEQARLDEHLTACVTCQAAVRDFELVGQALDIVPLERPAGLATLRQDVLARVQPPARPRGLLIRMLFPIAAAAAVLVAAWLSIDALRPSRLQPAQLTAIKQGADELLRSNRQAEAVRIYRLLLEQEGENPSFEARRLLSSVQRTLDAIERLERSRSSQDTELVITVYPDSPVVPCALAQLVAQRGVEPRVTPAIQESRPLVNLDPVAIADLRMGSPEIRAVVSTSRPMQQVVLLQQGLRYEDLGQLASAREAFEQVIELDPETEAARAARAGLARLG